MTILKCDVCGKEVDALEKMTEEGYEGLDVCETCQIVIQDGLGTIIRRYEKNRERFLSQYFTKVADTKVSHPEMYYWEKIGSTEHIRFTPAYLAWKEDKQANEQQTV